jgi:DnaJ homolog subfamily C member 13
LFAFCLNDTARPIRDSVLASLLDTIKAAGNRNAHIATSGAARGMRWLPLWATVDEEAEKMVLKLIQPPLSERSYTELLERFNANVPYNGLAHITAPTVISPIDFLTQIN